MSGQDAMEFWKKVQQDEAFRKAVASATQDAELEALIRGAGFTVTADELQVSMEGWQARPGLGRELSERDLEVVAGGSINFGSSSPSLLLYGTIQTGLTKLTLQPTYKGFTGP